MYEKHWGLNRAPFNEAHNAGFFVDHSAADLVFVKLRHIAQYGQSSAAITGPAGIGKTAILKAFLRELGNEGWGCSYIASPIGSQESIICQIAEDLGVTGENPAESLAHALLSIKQNGQRACVVIDEAHVITNMELLESLRMLLNVEIGGELPITIILAGQEGLPLILRQASRFDQRLAMTIRIKPLDETAAKHYILTRLKVAGCSRGIFTRSAADRIIEISQGIPRQINRICELALVAGCGYGTKKIKSDIINMVAEELFLLPESKPVSDEEQSQRETAPADAIRALPERKVSNSQPVPIQNRPVQPGGFFSSLNQDIYGQTATAIPNANPAIQVNSGIVKNKSGQEPEGAGLLRATLENKTEVSSSYPAEAGEDIISSIDSEYSNLDTGESEDVLAAISSCAPPAQSSENTLPESANTEDILANL
jgi:general secretion pathway protein A